MEQTTSSTYLPKLETDSLILRRLTEQDTEDIFNYGSNPDVSKYVSWDVHQSLGDIKEFVNAVLQQYQEKQKPVWGIELKASGRLIGTIDYVTLNSKHKNAEIGYVLSKDYWGKGFTSEAAEKVIAYGFDKLGLERIQAHCFTENVGSQKVMEKVGMTFEGILRKSLFVKGRFQDVKLYSILREEWGKQ